MVIRIPKPPPSAQFVIGEKKELLKPAPVLSNFFSDYRKILTEDVNICDYVDNQGYKQVWIWSYQNEKTGIFEWGWAPGQQASTIVGPGDLHYGLPVCNKTYVAYNFNYFAGDPVHSVGHSIEALFGMIDNNLWGKYQFPFGEKTKVNHCGTIHQPPNNPGADGQLCTDSAACNYGYLGEVYAQSDCQNWKPDGTGQIEAINCRTYHGGDCIPETIPKYYVWWMQNIPGLNSNLEYFGLKLKNWWDFYTDFDATVLARGKNLAVNEGGIITNRCPSIYGFNNDGALTGCRIPELPPGIQNNTIYIKCPAEEVIHDKIVLNSCSDSDVNDRTRVSEYYTDPQGTEAVTGWIGTSGYTDSSSVPVKIKLWGSQPSGDQSNTPSPLSLNAPHTTVAGSPIVISWSNHAQAAVNDWVGIFPKGGDERSYKEWVYISSCTKSAPGSAVKNSGSCLLSVPIALEGEYELRMFAQGQYSLLGKSNAIVISKTGASVTAAPTNLTPSSNITVTWKNVEGAAQGDWIALHLQTADDRTYVNWFWTASCTKVQGITPKTSGSCTLSLPNNLAQGNYELRFHPNHGFSTVFKSGTLSYP